MERTLRVMAGVSLGVLFGAGVVLLLAPQSGADTQRAIKDYFDWVLQEGRRAAEERRLELMTRFEEMKQPPAPEPSSS